MSRISLIGLIGLISPVVLVSCKLPEPQPPPKQEVIRPPVDYSGFKVEERTVRGNSLAALINEGTTVKIVFDYYKTNEVARGDVVAYAFSGNKDPIIKIAHGIPGDKVDIRNDGQKWRLVINDEVVINSEGKPYVMDDRACRMLGLYITDYKGVIPNNAYLILGNLPEGTTDSTRFGLVDRSDILGKVLYK